MKPPAVPTGPHSSEFRLFELFYAEHHDSIARALTLVLGDPQLAADAT